MYMPSLRIIYETWRSQGPQTPIGPPTTRNQADFNFSIF